MGYDQHTVPDVCSCRTYFGCFPLALSNICPWPPVPFFQILWRTVNSKPPTIPFGSVACTFPTTFLEIAVYKKNITVKSLFVLISLLFSSLWTIFIWIIHLFTLHLAFLNITSTVGYLYESARPYWCGAFAFFRRKNDAYVPGVYVIGIQELTHPCMKAFTCKVWFFEFKNHGFIDINLTCPETFNYIIIFYYFK